MLEINDLKSKNDHLFTEYSRVDQELAKAIEAIKHAEDELVTKEFMVIIYLTSTVALYIGEFLD